MNTPTTAVHKSIRGGWQAKTSYPLEGERRLTITTHKANRGITTYCQVAKHERDGTMSFMLYRDFGKTILRDSAARCTEKTVRYQHAIALNQVEALLTEARTFYAREDAEVAAALPA